MGPGTASAGGIPDPRSHEAQGGWKPAAARDANGVVPAAQGDWDGWE